MPVDKIELAKDLETPEYQTIVKETLAKKEFTIRTKDEETSFQDNFKKDVIEKEIPKKISEVHTQYDKDVEEITGLKREQNEKSYDFVKRALKANTGDTTALRTEITDLKKQIAAGDNTGATKKLLDEAENKFKASLAEKDQLIQKLQGETTATKRESLLTSAYAGVKKDFKKELPPMFDRTEKAILSEVLSGAVVGDDGKLYMGDGKGGVLKDKSFNPVLVETHLREEFKAVIDVTKPKGGAGSTPPPGGSGKTNPDEITVENFEMPDNLKNADDLMTYLLEVGIKRGTDQFNKIWEKFRPTLPDGKSFKVPAPPPTPAAK
jgi:hypothetical protein